MTVSFKSLKFVCSIIALSFSFLVQSQEFQFGAKGGINIASISFSDSDYSTSSVIGVHVGAFGKFSIDEKLAIQPELFFSTGGNTWSISNVEGEINTTHLTLPVLLQYSITDALYAEAGPQYSFLLSIKQSINDGESEDIKEFYKSGAFGLGIGIGYNLESLVSGLSANVRYTTDLTDINDVEVDAGSLKSNMFQIGLAYTFSK
tara:strand:- start:106920 stop:107531 length:612 start_codon:yes stop_codon:yes gene_type:complete